MSSEDSQSTRPEARLHIPFYDDVLKVVEIWLVLGFLSLVILATFVNILDRNFQLGLWEYAIVEKMVYSMVFYVGLYGGVIAARRAKHIAIDAVTHFLSERMRLYLGVLLQAIGGVTCFVLMMACYDWVYEILHHDSTLIPGRDEWWVRTRLWRWPVIIAFGWMALHFFVNSGRFFVQAFRPIESAPSSEEAE